MSSDGGDGAPTIEEVLASIRRIIAGSSDDAAAPLPPMIRAPTRVLQDDFELPALFRSPRHERPAQSKHVVAGRHDPREDRFLRSNPEKWRSAARQAQAAEAALSALTYQRTTTGREELSSSVGDPASTGDISSAPPSVPPPPLLHDIPRQMIPCKDTTIARMRRPLSTSEASTESCKAPPHRDVATGSELIDAAELIVPDPSALFGAEGDAEIGKMVTNQLHQTAVELLRPILVQWFEANARPIFEEALRAEIDPTKER